MEMDNIEYFVAKGPRVLPQGAPTSPMLTNILCYKLDKRLAGLANKNGFNYSRYADDLSFSAKGESTENLTKLLWAVRKVTESEGFVLHPEKLRIMRKGARQEVTGLVVNEQLGISRKNLRKFRALLHQIKLAGWQGKQWGSSPNLVYSVYGYANFVKMVKPKQGEKLLQEVQSLIAQWKVKPTQTPPPLSNKLADKISEEQEKLKKDDGKKEDDQPRWKLW